ncbi:MAG: hypothetical protein ACWGPS_04935 [Candidatus Promineifilaceae bacterium]
MDIIQTIHSIVRWAIVFVGLIALIKFAAGWLATMAYQRFDRILMSSFMGLLDLQLILGIILLIGRGLAAFRIEHAVSMIVAIVLVHLSVRWRDKEDRIKFRNNFIVILAALIIIYLGVSILPQGWLG